MNNIKVPELIGNGIFESLRTYNGKIFKFQEHLQRFEQSAKALKLVLPSVKKIEEKILKTFAKSALKDAYIRVSFSEENGLIVIVKPLPIYPEEYYKNGVEVFTVPIQRNIPLALDAKIKCENFLSGILATLEFQLGHPPKAGRGSKCNSEKIDRKTGTHEVGGNYLTKIEGRTAFEAILLNKDGYVTEGTISNIFIICYTLYPTRQFCFVTSPSYIGVLEGITRKVVMEIAERLKIPVEEKPFTRYNIYTADECFLTNTTMEIMPVTKVDGRIIGDGRPGTITYKLMKEFKSLVSKR